MKTLGLCLDTVGVTPTQYAGMDFDSICEFEGMLLESNGTGLYYANGELDLGTINIDAKFTLPSTDLGTYKVKKVRAVYLSGWMLGKLKLTLLYDGVVGTSSYTIPSTGGIEEETIKIDINSEDSGRYIGLQIENVDGADFSIDSIDMLIIPTVLQSKQTKVLLGRGKVVMNHITGAGTGT